MYFDIKAVEVVLKDAPDVSYAHFEPSRAQLTKLKHKGPDPDAGLLIRRPIDRARTSIAIRGAASSGQGAMARDAVRVSASHPSVSVTRSS